MSRKRYAVFKRFDGKVFIVDLFKLRMSRIRGRVFAWARACSDLLASGSGYKRCMITLTYDTLGTLVDASSYEPNHIKQYLDRLRHRRGLDIAAYAWVLELQENGTPHYHIMLIYKGSVPYPDKSGMWSHGMSNITFRIKTVYYITTYLKKGYQKNFDLLPSGARAFAVSIKDKERRDRLRLYSLSDDLQKAVVEHGWEVLEMLIKPEWYRSLYVGSSVTKEYAEWLKGETLDSVG